MAGSLDIDALLQPVPGDSPAGPDMVYEAPFGDFQRAATRIAPQVMGNETREGFEPDWSGVLARGQELLGLSKDLRIAVPLTEAAVRVQGLPGLASGLGLIQRLLADFWGGVHPLLDADDDNDPTERVNALLPLADPERVLEAVRTAVLVQSRAAGRFSFRDWQIASGEIPAPAGAKQSPPELPLVEAAFTTSELEALQATAASVTAAQAALKAIEVSLTERLSTSSVPDLGTLAEVLKAMGKLLATQLGARGVVAVSGPEPGADGEAPVRPVVSGEIRSRDDATRTLDRLCAYFEQHEPSSPVPLLLRRAKRLISADFLTILRDLTPEGVSQAEKVAGVQPGADGRK